MKILTDCCHSQIYTPSGKPGENICGKCHQLCAIFYAEHKTIIKEDRTTKQLVYCPDCTYEMYIEK